jgi:hypothetical protein
MAPSPRSPAPLRVCVVDLNNGVANQAIRSFKTLVRNFGARARETNPGLELELFHVQPRNLNEAPPPDCDLYLSSGGPDSPLDGFEELWCPAYRRFLDGVVEDQARGDGAARAAFLVCYSFEIGVMHFGIARMEPRERKFGIMPVYPTDTGMRSPLLGSFGDRFFAWEHRSWQAVDLDERRLRELGGELLARESRDGWSKGPGLTSFRFTPGIEGTIFHPEADRPGALAWIERPEQAAAVIGTYGEITYRRMLKTLDDPMRLARTYALLIPGWLARKFNALAPARGWNPVEPPTYDGTELGFFDQPAQG